MIRRVLLTVGLSVALGSISGSAQADEVERVPLKPKLLPGTRAPIAKNYDLRTNEITLERYHKVAKVVRKRTTGKKSASFTAEPYLIDSGAVMVFEIRSVAASGSISRWRCIAENDVAECLGTPVRIRYLPNDDRLVLTARFKPKGELPALQNALASR